LDVTINSLDRVVDLTETDTSDRNAHAGEERLMVARDAQRYAGTYAEVLRRELFKPSDRKSVRQAAKEIDISYEHLRKMTRGDVSFSLTTNNRVCEYLKLDSEIMWRKASNEKILKRYPDADHEIQMPKDVRLHEAWPWLTDEQKGRICEIADGLAQANKAEASTKQLVASGGGKRR
jgi:hypothetical protein